MIFILLYNLYWGDELRDEQSIKNGSIVGKYRVVRLLTYGTNVFVYEVEYAGQRYIMKELFPECLYERNIIRRTYSNRIILNNKSKYFFWKQAKKEFLNYICIGKELSCYPDFNETISDAAEVFCSNGTVYAVYPYKKCADWECITGESYELILKRCADIADIIWKIHKHGWLLVDIKSSNFLVEEDGSIKLCDLDSMVKISEIKNQYLFKCSSETAPRELLCGDVRYVSEKSDLYSLAAMLCTKITGKPYNNDTLKEMAGLIISWNKTVCNEFMDVLYEALDDNVVNRYMNVKEFGEHIRKLVR